MDFADLDATRNWARKEEKYELVRALGYDYISEAIHDLYYGKGKPISEVGALLEFSEGQVVTTVMNLWGWERRPKGGNNYSGKLREYAHAIRLGAEAADNKNRYCRDIARKYGVTAQSIHNVLDGRTHAAT